MMVLLILAASQGRLVGTDFPPQKKAEKVETVNLQEVGIDIERVTEFFPDAQRLQLLDTAYMDVYNADDVRLGSVLFSSPYSDEVIGYGGPTPLLIGVDTKGKIVGVQVLENAETPSFLRRVVRSGFLDNWNGLSVSDALQKEVDHVTGATFTSKAIAQSMQLRLAVADRSDRLSGGVQWSSILKQLALVAVLALALFSFFSPAKAKKLRIPLLILSVAILGFWQGSMLSLAQLFAFLTNGTSLAAQWALLVILAFAISLPFFTGKAFYCVYLCPFGAAQELAGKLKKKKIQLGQRVITWLLVLRKAILIAIVLLLIFGVGIDAATLGNIEPFSAFNLSLAPTLAIVIACVSLVFSIFITKPWCRFLCPTGQTLDTMKKGRD